MPPHRPRPSPNSLESETRVEQRLRREETLSRLVALLREDPEASSHQLRLALPFLTVKDTLIAEARRLAREPLSPPASIPEEVATA